MVLLPDSPPPVKNGGQSESRQWNQYHGEHLRPMQSHHKQTEPCRAAPRRSSPAAGEAILLPSRSNLTSLAATIPSSFRFFSMALLRSRAARSSALSVHPMFPGEWAIPSSLRSALSLADSQSVPCLSLELSSCAVCYSIRPGLRAERSRDPETVFSPWLCASLAPSPISEGIGGWGRCARACGVGVVVRWGGGLSLSLSLQGGAGDDDDSERERFHRIFSRRQAGGAREEERSRVGCARHNLTYVRATQL